jgi:hypothetical protein
MKKLLEFLLTGCFHEWEIISKSPVYYGYKGTPEKELPIGVKYTLRCKKCGELKTYHDY